jgi:hypothetical protein
LSSFPSSVPMRAADEWQQQMMFETEVGVDLFGSSAV